MSARPVLLAYDGSQDARHAISVAGSLLSGSAVVLHVWTMPHPPSASGLAVGMPGLPTLEESEEAEMRVRRHAHHVVDEGVAHANRAGFTATPELAAGDGGVSAVWHAIASVADDRDARVIVLGHRGLSRVRSVLLGSVSHAVVQHTSRPVLVIPVEQR